MNKLKVLVITQDDNFAIPKNIDRLVNSKFIDLVGCFLIETKSTLSKRRTYFAKGFGYKQSLKMGFKILKFKFFNAVYKLTRYRRVDSFKTIEDICRVSSVILQKTQDINSHGIVKEIARLDPDIIVSFSAPTVFKSELLNIPKFGCINLHCSKLPSYSGVMPSFWVLLNNERETGCSVHTMDDRIDNGHLLGQSLVSIAEYETMFTLIIKTKDIGGLLMMDVLNQIYLTQKLPMPISIDESSRQYYSWPNDDDFCNFRNKGKALI
jgi:folate-dependent phosphoribosylglycinamide formyltransferase PurN